MYKIGEFSHLCSLPVKTLRYYADEGLLLPAETDPFTGYRYYRAAQLPEVYRIAALKELGYTLAEIRQYLHAGDAAQTLALLDERCEALAAEARALQRRQGRLAALKDRMKEGDKAMIFTCARETAPIRTAWLRRRFATKDEALRVLKELRGALPERICGEKSIIINYETEWRESDLDLAVCVELTGALPAGCAAAEKTIAYPGLSATAVCRGEDTEEAYRSILRFTEEEECAPTGAFYEIRYPDGTVEVRLPLAERQKDTPAERAPFTDDPAALGEWRLLDIVPSAEQFSYGHPKNTSDSPLKTLYFFIGGEAYWIYAGWTKGILYTNTPEEGGVFARSYEIREQDGRTLLFLDWNNRGAPQIWIYEKVSGARLTATDIRRRDRTELPFCPDDAVLGTWRVRDFVRRKEAFDPTRQNRARETLFLRSMEFLPDRTLRMTTRDGLSTLAWTRGMILNRRSETACAYELRRENGRDLLIREWKSGDYAYAGLVQYYIMEKESNP